MQLVGCIDPPCGKLLMEEEEEEGRLLIFFFYAPWMLSPHTDAFIVPCLSADPSAQVSLTLSG